MTFYTGDAFPKWRHSIFNGALALTHLNRLEIDGERILHEERLLTEKNWRVRFVEQDANGFLYLGVDDGLIIRLRPAANKE